MRDTFELDSKVSVLGACITVAWPDGRHEQRARMQARFDPSLRARLEGQLYVRPSKRATPAKVQGREAQGNGGGS